MHVPAPYLALMFAATACSPVEPDPGIAPAVNGLAPAAAAPSFMPTHVTGSHAGQKACPLCIHGNKPQLQIWAQESSLDQALEIAKKADRELGSTAQTYIVLVPAGQGKPSGATLSRLRNADLESAFSTYVPSWTDKETSGLYNHTEAAKPKIRVYSVVNRRMYARWDEPKPTDWAGIRQKVKDSQRFQADYSLTDRQIAPTWEPGQRFRVAFEVFDKSGKPLANAKVTAWQTDQSGLYNPREFGHVAPRLQVTAWTDKSGRIEFDTIYPGPYPDQPEPSHIHFAIPIQGKEQWRTLWFEGDPLLTAEKRKWELGNEETVIVRVDKSKPVWQTGHRYIVQ